MSRCQRRIVCHSEPHIGFISNLLLALENRRRDARFRVEWRPEVPLRLVRSLVSASGNQRRMARRKFVWVRLG